MSFKRLAYNFFNLYTLISLSNRAILKHAWL